MLKKVFERDMGGNNPYPYQSVQAGASGSGGSGIRAVGSETPREARVFRRAPGAESHVGFGLPTTLKHLKQTNNHKYKISKTIYIHIIIYINK